MKNYAMMGYQNWLNFSPYSKHFGFDIKTLFDASGGKKDKMLLQIAQVTIHFSIEHVL